MEKFNNGGNTQQGGTGTAELVIEIPVTTSTINVTTNTPAATFTITGPATFNGSGTSFTKTDVPPGSYTIQYGAVSGYAAPGSQTQTLAAGGVITFSGTYQPCTFTLTLDRATALPSQEANPLTSTIPARSEQVVATATLAGSPNCNGQAVGITADPDTLILGGHDHFSGPAGVGGNGFGDFNSTATGTVSTCTTDSNECSVTLIVPRFSGRYRVVARLAADPATKDQQTVNVGIEFLTPAEAAAIGLSAADVSLNTLAPDPTYILTGGAGDRHCDGSLVMSMHSANHFGTDLLRKDLRLIASQWLNDHTFPIRINDMSLVNGGVFDVNNDWDSNEHAAHRYGVNADIEWHAGANGACVPLTDTEKTELYRLILRVTGRPPAPEDPLTHWHVNHPISHLSGF